MSARAFKVKEIERAEKNLHNAYKIIQNLIDRQRDASLESVAEALNYVLADLNHYIYHDLGEKVRGG